MDIVETLSPCDNNELVPTNHMLPFDGLLPGMGMVMGMGWLWFKIFIVRITEGLEITWV